jgi:tetratricopeptide (TPR) repeat protein
MSQCVPFFIPAQALTDQIDSLKRELEKASTDTSRCNLLVLLAENAPDEEWPLYNTQLKELAGDCLKKISRTNGTYKQFQKYYAIALNNEGYFLRLKGDVKAALRLFSEGLRIREEISDLAGVGESLNNIADIYDTQGDSKMALVYFKKAFGIFEKMQDKVGMGYSLNNIGFIYKNRDEIEQAMECYQRSLKLRRESNDKDGIATSLINIAGIYYLKNDYNHVLETYKSCVSLYHEIGNDEGEAFTLNNIGTTYLEMGQLNQALDFSMRSLQLAKAAGYPENICNAAENLHKIYKALKDHKQSLVFFELYIAMRDSINNEETRKSSVKNLLKYEYDKKAAADSVVNAEEQKVKDAQLFAQSSKLKQERAQFWFLVCGLSFVVCSLLFVVNRFRITQKQKKIIEEQKVQVDIAFAKLHEKNREVLDSIYYARRIQRALLTSEKYIIRNLKQLSK